MKNLKKKSERKERSFKENRKKGIIFRANAINKEGTKTFRCQCRSKGNISGGARERRRREPLEGSGGMLPQKILKSRGLEMPFPAFSKSYL